MSENAYFIKTRENGYQDRSIVEIVREMLSHADACWMSAKKDALVNIGGFIATNDESLLRRCQELVVLYEGFHSYGGLARRDLEAMAQGLREGTDEEYLAHRIRLVAYLGEQLQEQGIVISQPVGGSGVFIDVEKLYPHLGPDRVSGDRAFLRSVPGRRHPRRRVSIHGQHGHSRYRRDYPARCSSSLGSRWHDGCTASRTWTTSRRSWGA